MIAAAMMAASLGRFVNLTVAVNAYGVRGTGTVTVDRLTGHFVRRFNAGPASEQEGWDGARAWRADATGVARVQGNSGERREIESWGKALRLAITASEHEAVLSGASDRVRVTFDRFVRSGPLTVPGRIRAVSQQNGTWIATLTSFDTRESVSPAAFSPPLRRPSDFRLDALTRIPISTAGGAPTLQVRINGQPLTFLFDTGGQNVLTIGAAQKLHLTLLGSATVAGGGGGTAAIQYTTVNSVQIGDAVLVRQPFIVLPAAALPPVDGIVGYELLARLAARLDLAHSTLELAPDASYFGRQSAPIPFGYFDRQPQVAGSLPGVRGAFSIDTGSSLTVQVQTPIVNRDRLVSAWHATVATYAEDVGGRYPIYLVRAKYLALGFAVFPNPIADLLTRSSLITDGSIAGNVGTGILRRWVIVFNYPRQQIELLPGGDPNGNVVHDRSGMYVSSKGDALVAQQVFAGTPAAAAGINEGDRIANVNGEAVGAADVARVRALLQGAPGTIVRIALSDGSVHAVTLRQYL